MPAKPVTVVQIHPALCGRGVVVTYRPNYFLMPDNPPLRRRDQRELAQAREFQQARRRFIVRGPEEMPIEPDDLVETHGKREAMAAITYATKGQEPPDGWESR